jgi:hypothetical protein
VEVFTSIDTILSLGDDALSQEWEIILPPFPGAIDATSTALRITDLTLPEISIGTYNIDYKTQSFTKPNGKITTPHTFDFTFRIDKFWQVYQGLENWLNFIGNNDSGIMSPDILAGQASLVRIPIDIIPIDSNGTVTKAGWSLTGCFISKLDGVTFNQSGTVLTAKAEFNYVKRVTRS